MTVTSLCLGLDVSPKRLGWALARLEDGAPVACGCEAIELPANGWSLTPMVEAFIGIRGAELRGGYEIHYLAVERPALPPKSGTNGAFNAGRTYQMALVVAGRNWPWAVMDEMQPSEWRKLAGLAGNASKDEVFEVASISGFPLIGMNLRLQQDAADAACIALAGVERNRQTLATPAGEAGR